MADKMSIDNKDPIKEDSEDSMGSSPEGELPPSTSNGNTQETQPPKRKGGRKPIYATSEERKQRNRQAQAAFRERRTEYIKQLEETIRAHESNLHNLQAAHRTAADECLMLRYKNSLLERILLEKGIDVQAELRAKTGSPNLGPTHVPQNMVQPPPIQRAIMNRHQSRRSASSIAPKIEPGVSPLPAPLHSHPSSAASPKSRPTPSSHTNSPTNPGPPFASQPAVSPATSDHAAMRSGIPPVLKQQLSPLAPINPARSVLPPAGRHVRVGANDAFYSTSGFQNHLVQLEQEYDAPEMLDDSDIDTPSGPGPYPSTYGTEPPQPMIMSPTTSAPTHHPGSSLGVHSSPVSQAGYPSMTQLLDSNVDWDPFGLSASMAFPTPFSFDPNTNLR